MVGTFTGGMVAIDILVADTLTDSELIFVFAISIDDGVLRSLNSENMLRNWHIISYPNITILYHKIDYI